MSHLADFGPKKTSMMARLLGRKKSGGAAEGDLPMEQQMEQKDLTIARLMEEMSAVAAQNLGLGSRWRKAERSLRLLPQNLAPLASSRPQEG